MEVMNKMITSRNRKEVCIVMANGFGISDCFFNLGSALAFVQVIPPGVYVAMNSMLFDGDNVRKNLETGKFQEVGNSYE